MTEELREFEARRGELLGVLEEGAKLAREVGSESIAERIESEVMQRLRSGSFHLVVVGEFNHGKTSFVNALLGKPLLPVGVTPTTAVIHHVVHGEEPSARLVFADGSESPLAVEELSRFSAQDAEASEENRNSGVRERPPSYLELSYPSALLESSITLVDTPGVNDLSLTRAEITYGYIPRSDAVLFLLDAGQPLKESERRFLEQQLLERSRDKILFVVTKADIWSADEREQALEYIEGRLRKLVRQPKLFAVSAQEALAGRGGDLDKLVGYLKRFLAEERGKILLDNAAIEGQRALGALSHGVEARRRSSALSLVQLERRITALEQELEGNARSIEERRLEIREAAGAIKTGARKDLQHFVDDTVARLPVLLAEASGEEVRLHLGAFVEQGFRDFLERETRSMAQDLEGLADRMVALLSEEQALKAAELAETLGGSLKAPSVEVDTFAYDFGILAVMTVGLGTLFANALLGGALLVAAPALALWQRGRTEREIKRRAQELLPAALQGAADEVAQALDGMVDAFTKALDEWIVSAMRQLHVELVEVLRKTRAERLEGSRDREALTQQAADLAARLLGLQQALAGFRLELPVAAG
ncbi:MAG: dynamin family protein [Polyangiaceae bacterium]